MRKLWIPLIIVVVLAVAYVAAGSSAGARAGRAEAALKAAGHPVTVEDIDPAFSAGSESAARVYSAAAALLSTGDLERLKLIDSLGWKEGQPANAELLKDKSAALELVAQAAAMGPADFGMNVRDGFAAKICPILRQYSGFRTLLRMDALELAAGGKPDSALAVLATSTRMAHAFAEPPVIYHLVSMIKLDSVFTAAAAIAPKAGVPAIEQLAAEFARLDFKAAEYRSLQSEAVITGVAAAAGQTTMSGLPALLVRLLVPLRKYGQAQFLETVYKQFEVVREPWYKGQARLAAIELPQKGLMGGFVGIYVFNTAKFYERSERITAWRDVAAIGLKALVMKKQSGRLPEDLAAIDPNTPVDRFSGKPYVYKVLPDGFEVYSVGPDGKDDGGVASTDLVFRVEI
jgi:hypothetical protein